MCQTHFFEIFATHLSSPHSGKLPPHSGDPEQNTNFGDQPSDQAAFQEAVKLLETQFPRKKQEQE
tara:strand:+ start:271 stop:465 length:195 start_codon:yes stop_codon:yes gene_type:complete